MTHFFPKARGFPGGSEGKEPACNTGDLGSITGLGISPWEGNGNPLQYFCLENPMDRGAWQATVYRVQKSWTWLKQPKTPQFSCSVVSDYLWPHESQHARPPCPSPTPGVHPDSRPSSQWCHPAISSSVIPFSSCPQSLPASESFTMSQLFAWGGQSTSYLKWLILFSSPLLPLYSSFQYFWVPTMDQVLF